MNIERGQVGETCQGAIHGRGTGRTAGEVRTSCRNNQATQRGVGSQVAVVHRGGATDDPTEIYGRIPAVEIREAIDIGHANDRSTCLRQVRNRSTCQVG